jgi:hypothetical protein
MRVARTAVSGSGRRSSRAQARPHQAVSSPTPRCSGAAWSARSSWPHARVARPNASRVWPTMTRSAGSSATRWRGTSSQFLSGDISAVAGERSVVKTPAKTRRRAARAAPSPSGAAGGAGRRNCPKPYSQPAARSRDDEVMPGPTSGGHDFGVICDDLAIPRPVPRLIRASSRHGLADSSQSWGPCGTSPEGENGGWAGAHPRITAPAHPRDRRPPTREQINVGSGQVVLPGAAATDFATVPVSTGGTPAQRGVVTVELTRLGPGVGVYPQRPARRRWSGRCRLASSGHGNRWSEAQQVGRRKADPRAARPNHCQTALPTDLQIARPLSADTDIVSLNVTEVEALAADEPDRYLL